MHNLILSLLVASGAFAHTQDPYLGRCQALLGITIEHLGDEPTDVRWMKTRGIGRLGFMSGSWPPSSAEVVRNANEQGVIHWFQRIAVAKSIEEARAHDQDRIPYRRVMYLITDLTVDDLETSEMDLTLPDAERTRRRRAAQEKMAQILTTNKLELVYFEEQEFDEEQHERGQKRGGEKPLSRRGTNLTERIPRALHRVDPAQARLMIHADEFGFFRDGWGGDFLQYGYFRMPKRAVATIATTFLPKSSGLRPQSRFVSQGYDLLKRLVKNGYTIREDIRMEDAIALEMATPHNIKNVEQNPDGSPVLNSRVNELHLRDLLMEASRRGEAGALGLVAPDGNLTAASIYFRGPNRLFSVDLLAGIDVPKVPVTSAVTSQKNYFTGLQMRKAMMVLSIVYAGFKGYSFTDCQTVTEITSMAKAFFIPADAFDALVDVGPDLDWKPGHEPWPLPSLKEIYQQFPPAQPNEPADPINPDQKRPRIFPRTPES